MWPGRENPTFSGVGVRSNIIAHLLRERDRDFGDIFI